MPYMLPQEERPNWDTFCFYSEVFTSDECDKIIALGKSIPSHAAVLREGVVDVEQRKTTISWIPWDTGSDWIYSKLSSIVMDANQTRFRFNLTGFQEPLQFTQYLEPDDRYEWHQDLGAGILSIRKLSMVVQLSDESSYEGGDLQFFMLRDRESLRKRGTVFVFPSYEVHRVTPLIRGQRYSLVSWVSGPPFV